VVVLGLPRMWGFLVFLDRLAELWVAMTDAIILGELAKWPSKEELAAALRKAGLRVYVGRYSVRVEDCSCFSFEQYGGDLGPPVIEAGADTLAKMLQDTERVSAALRRAGLVHRFEVFNEEDQPVGYFHFGWPKEDR
jgi:hypothetical protein